jgi:hypothetical protein
LNHNVVGKIHLFINSYLYKRFQTVLIDNTISQDKVSYSNWKEVKNWVPQGLILGPLPFLLYINDSPKIAITVANIIFFANDTSIIVTNKL